MRRSLVIALTLFLTSMANAGLWITVDGVVDPPELYLTPDQHAVIGIWGDGQTPTMPPSRPWLIIEGPGTVAGGVMLYPGSLAALTLYEEGDGSGIVEWLQSEGYDTKQAYYIELVGTMGEYPYEGTLVDEIVLHCDDIGDVLLTLVSDDLTHVYDTQVIHQVREPTTLYVDDDAPGDPGPNDPNISDPCEDGSTDHPFDAIQEAINAAIDLDTVLVAPGTYTGPGNRDIDFKGKAITVSSIEPNDPSVVAATVIDGDSDYYSCLEGCYGYPQCEPHRGFNFRNGEGPDSVLAGFTITRFCAPDELIWNDPMPAGGGIFCENSSPTILYCVITDNWAHKWGAGGFGGNICCKGTCSPTITHCTISKGDSYFGAGGIHCPDGSPVITNCIITDNDAVFATGGGIWCGDGSTVAHCTISNNYGGGGIYTNGTISYCTIENNTSIILHHGGGIYGSPAVDHCIIRNNRTSPGSGAGIYFTSSAATISNSIIAGNLAGSGEAWDEWYDGIGGGIYCQGNPTITECTITGNSAARGGGVYGNAIITNCIIWNNTAPNEPLISGDPNVSYSDVEGGWPGVGNISVDPCFVDENNNDYHLKSQAGHWDPNSQSWVQDDVTSPCIDAGNPGCPLEDEPNDVNNVRINMGAYGGTAQASKTPIGWGLLADLDNDWIVNFLDYAAFLQWALPTDEQPWDLNRDGQRDFRDLRLLTDDWLKQRNLDAGL